MAEIHRVAVVGAGTMGHGIAYVAALSGYSVALTDAQQEALPRAEARIAQLFARGVERGKVTTADRDAAMARLRVSPSMPDAARDADLVVEAIAERLSDKQALLRELEHVVSERTILASNTSSLPIASLGAATRHPGRVIGMHFFNPVPVMRLVEVVRGPETTDTVVQQSCAFAQSLGKTPIVVRDSPGFATSRLGVVLGLEAIRMLEQGVASAEDIDRAMELGYNHPMGPLRLTDLVGLDVRLAIAEHLHATLGDDTYRPPALLRQLVDAGKLGRKSGEGFYRWEDAR
ncbi:MAG TPA: 3-hydroxyacyl-CoA dehydrogenase family protein [Gemmatimonadaceae bacterium]|nr:3-hydroxyacyl-CoA dehydrogenase family protein [Gemmatimonadaceae bacterium]